MEVSARHNLSLPLPTSFRPGRSCICSYEFSNVCRRWPHSIILEREGPNDGLVSVESSKWVSRSPLTGISVISRASLNSSPLQGTYLGTLQDVSHLDQVGWINTARYSWARFRGRDIPFHPATFYLSIANHLAREVDGVQPESEPIEEDPWDASSDRDDSERQT